MLNSAITCDAATKLNQGHGGACTIGDASRYRTPDKGPATGADTYVDDSTGLAKAAPPCAADAWKIAGSVGRGREVFSSGVGVATAAWVGMTSTATKPRFMPVAVASMGMSCFACSTLAVAAYKWACLLDPTKTLSWFTYVAMPTLSVLSAVGLAAASGKMAGDYGLGPLAIALGTSAGSHLIMAHYQRQRGQRDLAALIASGN